MADEDLYGGEYPEEGYEDGLEDMQTSETSAVSPCAARL